MGEVATAPPVRLVFAGTTAFAVPVLQTLVDEKYRIAAVVTQPDRPAGRGHTVQPPPVKIKALELNLPVHQPTTLKSEDAQRLFQTLAPEIVVVVAYGKILPGWLLQLPRYGAVNVHGSLLPRYRGAAPIQWAMANGEKETGVCTMLLDEGLDTGPVYACERTPIDPDETVQELSSRLSALGCDLIKRTLEGILAGTLKPVPQDHSRATLAPILTKRDGVIDWTLPAHTIHNRIRAFNPWPGTRTGFRNTVCRILKSRIKTPLKVNDKQASDPGTLVIGNGADRFVAAVCGSGTLLELLEVQFPNRKPQKAMDFVNGFHVAAGEKFHHADGA